MDQLLRITSVPIKIDVTVTRAKLNYDNPRPKVNVSREKGGFKMQAQPIKVNIDNQPVRDTLNLKTSKGVTDTYAQDGLKLSYQATANFVQEGNELLDSKNISPAQIAGQQNARSIETVLSFLPSQGPDISWSDGTLNVEYATDDVDFDWDVSQRAGFEFIPASIEFIIKQMPKVEIEYVGGPIYAPPSADPNYVEPEIDTKA